MNLRFFEGPAGSGKTTRLVEELATTLNARPLREHERVLALTKMHGSRRRMQGRLSELPGLRGRFGCATVDSFAWRILRRWRSLARIRFDEEPAPSDYETVCRLAGALLADEAVRRWTASTYPVFLVDEMQDSKDSQLGIVQALSESATCLAAADDYQDLDASGTNAAVCWARQRGQVIALTQNHRTNAAGLLAATSALREGRTVPANGNGFAILGALCQRRRQKR